jgi:ribonuclease P protein component
MGAAVDTLKRRREFLRVAGARRNYAARGLVLQACPAETDSKEIRFGYTASRKVGNAVRRNRSRRRLRAAVEKVMPLHAAPGYDYVVIARAGTVERPFRSLTQDLETALRRLDVWRAE